MEISILHETPERRYVRLQLWEDLLLRQQSSACVSRAWYQYRLKSGAWSVQEKSVWVVSGPNDIPAADLEAVFLLALVKVPALLRTQARALTERAQGLENTARSAEQIFQRITSGADLEEQA